MVDLDPSSYVSPNFEIADDTKIGRNVSLCGRGYLGPGVRVGHGVVFDGDVRIGDGTRIGHHTVISGVVQIGPRNTLHPFCSIGEGPQHPEIRSSSGGILIGSDNVFREFLTLHSPTVAQETIVGNRCYIMAYCHIAHDCVVGNNVKMANNATLAGHVSVDDFSYLGLHSVVHQRLHIGKLSMIGMNSTLTKHAPPFSVVFNNRFSKINEIGLRKTGFSDQDIRSIEKYYKYGTRVELGNSEVIRILEAFRLTCQIDTTYKYDPL